MLFIDVLYYTYTKLNCLKFNSMLNDPKWVDKLENNQPTNQNNVGSQKMLIQVHHYFCKWLIFMGYCFSLNAIASPVFEIFFKTWPTFLQDTEMIYRSIFMIPKYSLYSQAAINMKYGSYHRKRVRVNSTLEPLFLTYCYNLELVCFVISLWTLLVLREVQYSIINVKI